MADPPDLETEIQTEAFGLGRETADLLHYRVSARTCCPNSQTTQHSELCHTPAARS